jgi:hypothetical protein
MGVSTRPSEGQRPVVFVDPAPRWGQQSSCGGQVWGLYLGLRRVGRIPQYKCGSAPMKVGAIPRDGRWPQLQRDPAEDVNTQPLR